MILCLSNDYRNFNIISHINKIGVWMTCVSTKCEWIETMALYSYYLNGPYRDYQTSSGLAYYYPINRRTPRYDTQSLLLNSPFGVADRRRFSFESDEVGAQVRRQTMVINRPSTSPKVSVIVIFNLSSWVDDNTVWHF